jgi:hypothetical protein
VLSASCNSSPTNSCQCIPGRMYITRGQVTVAEKTETPTRHAIATRWWTNSLSRPWVFSQEPCAHNLNTSMVLTIADALIRGPDKTHEDPDNKNRTLWAARCERVIQRKESKDHNAAGITRRWYHAINNRLDKITVTKFKRGKLTRKLIIKTWKNC